MRLAVRPISRPLTSAPLHCGWLLFALLIGVIPAQATNEIQKITLSGVTATQVEIGDGQGSATFAPSATAAQVQAALETLPSIGTGNVSVAGSSEAGGGDLTGNGTASASGSYGAGYEADKAFDNSLTTSWATPMYTSSDWLRYDFGSGQSKTLTEYTFQLDASSSTRPTAWSFQGSTDGNTWTSLHSLTGQNPGTGTKYTYTFTNGTAYRYYRLNITSKSYYTPMYFAEVEMIGSSGSGYSGAYTIEFIGTKANTNIAPLTTTTTGVTITTEQNGSPPPPDAPNAPTFSNIATTSLTVHLPSLPSGASTLTLQKKLAGEASTAYVTVATGLAGNASQTVTGLDAATSYSFRVLAVNAYGSTAGAGANVSTLTPAPNAPAAPTFSNIGTTSVRVTLPALPSNATSLTLQQKLDSQADTAYWDTDVNLVGGAIVDVVSLSAMTAYDFRCIAVGTSGSTVGAVGEVTTATPAPDAPGAPTFSNVTSTSLRATAPALPSYATSLTLQKKLQSEPNTDYASVATGLAGGAQTDVTGLAVETAHTFRYLALGNGGTTAGTPADITTSNAIPDPPQNVTATPGNTQVQIAWPPSSRATGYTLKWSTTSGGPYTSIPLTATSYNHTGLTNGTTYYYVVSASNDLGESANSGEVSAVPQVAPVAPQNLVATPGDGQVRLTWTASPGATGYIVQRATQSGGPYTTIERPVAAAYTNTNLVNGTTYYYVVRAVSNGVESAVSGEAYATPQAKPSSPYRLTATAGDTQVLLSWGASARAANYEVWRSGNGGTWTKVATQTGLTFTDTGLTNGTVYNYYVRASNVGGFSADSNLVSVTPAVLSTLAPGVPTFGAITATSIVVIAPPLPFRATSLTLQRRASSYGGSEYEPPAYATVATGLAGGAQTTVSGLTPNGSHTFRYVALGSGGSTPGNEASTSTLPPAPDAPEAPAFSAVTATSLTVQTPPLPAFAQSYTLQRKLASEADTAYTNQETNLSGDSSAAVSGLTVATAYRFRLIAVGAGGQSTGAGASVTTAPLSPATPQFSSISATGFTVRAGITGTALPAGATSLTLQRLIGNSPEYPYDPVYTTVSSGLNGEGQVVVSGLAPGQSYTFRYLAVGAQASTTGSSGSVSTGSGTAVAPGAPLFTEVGATSVQVWTPWPIGYEEGSWSLQQKLGNEADSAYVTIATGIGYYNTMTLVTGLTAGTQYAFRFIDSQAVAGASALLTTAPPAPGTPTFDQILATSVRITAPALPSGATSLTLQRRLGNPEGSGGTNYVTVQTGISGGGLTVVSDLTAGSTLGFRYLAVGSGGATPGTEATVTLFPPAPLEPQVPQFADLTATSVKVLMPPLPPYAQSLTLQKKLASEPAASYATIASGLIYGAQTVTGLTAETAYSFRFVAVGTGGETTGTGGNVTTLPLPPEAPDVPQFENVGTTSLTVVLPVLPARAASLTLQKLQNVGSGSQWINVATGRAGGASLTVSGLAPGGTYTFRCIAVGPGGETAGLGASVQMDEGAPEAPGLPRFSNLTEDSVVVTSPALSDGANSLTLQGKLSAQPDTAYLDIATQLGANTATPVTGLDSGTAYDFRYVAVGYGGETPGPAGSITTASAVVTWDDGDAISCAGIRWPETSATLQAGTEGRLSSYLATDWDDRITFSNGQGTTRPVSDPCSYTWAVTDSTGAPAGSFKNGVNSGQSVVWIAPTTVGTYTLRLVVDDQNAGNQPATQVGSRNDSQRGYNEEPLRFSTTVTVQP